MCRIFEKFIYKSIGVKKKDIKDDSCDLYEDNNHICDNVQKFHSDPVKYIQRIEKGLLKIKLEEEYYYMGDGKKKRSINIDIGK